MARPAIGLHDQIVEVGVRSRRSPPRRNVIVDFDAAYISDSLGIGAIDEVSDCRGWRIRGQYELIQLAKCLLLSIQIKVEVIAELEGVHIEGQKRGACHGMRVHIIPPAMTCHAHPRNGLDIFFVQPYSLNQCTRGIKCIELDVISRARIWRPDHRHSTEGMITINGIIYSAPTL